LRRRRHFAHVTQQQCPSTNFRKGASAKRDFVIDTRLPFGPEQTMQDDAVIVGAVDGDERFRGAGTCLMD
jgi:hypothetical protein